MTPASLILDGSICVFDRMLMQVLDLKAGRHPECWLGNASLAAILGCSERRVQEGLRRLRLGKLVDVVRDYSLRTRRRIVLLFRRGRGNPSVGAKACAETPPASAPTDGTPINKVSEDGREERVSVVVGAGVDAGTTTTSSAPPPGPEKAPSRAPDPGAVAEVAREAEAVFREPCKGRVISAARTWGLDWVRRAVGAAREHSARSWGYVLVTLREWGEGDGPPPEARAAAETPEEREARRRVFVEMMARQKGQQHGR